MIDGGDASGNTWAPAIIHKGVYTLVTVGTAILNEFGEDALYGVSPNGWTDNVLGRQWIEDVYDKQSRHL